MMLIPTVVEVSRDYTGHAYVLVEFREPRDGPAVLVEEFIMQLADTAQVATAWDEDGNPTAWETGPRDARAEMRENIRAFADNAEARGWRGDMTEGPPGQQTRQRDPNDNVGVVGVLKSEVGLEVSRGRP